MRTRPATFSLGLVFTLAYTRGGLVPTTPAPAPSNARAAVLAAMQHYADLIKAVGSDSVAAIYTADGELFEPGLPALKGREAIRAFLAPFDGKVTVDTVVTLTDTLELFGATAYQWGSYYQVARMTGQSPGSFSGRYVAQWRLEPDGEWRLARLLMQPAPPPTREHGDSERPVQ